MPSLSKVERVERVAEGGQVWPGRNALDAPEARMLMLALCLQLLRRGMARDRVEDSTTFENGDFERD
ncbi:MAG TPA: hypothetical protein PKL84_07760 [Candidatus Hydrogenedentes bacterium]|nr:hypothetical protein [Candidatus Hydrogenedentota bacterium]